MPVVYKVLPMYLELSVTYVSGSYPPIKGEGIVVLPMGRVVYPAIVNWNL